MDKKDKIKNRINNKVYTVVGNNLAKIRASTNKSQPDFATEINGFLKKEFGINANYDHKTISNWENRKSMPKLDVLVAISKHYGLALEDMLYSEIEGILSNSVFSNSEENLISDFTKYPSVCKKMNGKLVSSFAPEMYMYGQLSYLIDNLVDYRSELSRAFSTPSATKRASVVVGILDINNGKRELHFIGNGENDIVSIERPFNFFLDEPLDDCLDVFEHTIRLGNGKCYYINESPSEYDKQDVAFEAGNVPKDLSDYGLNKDEDDWTNYACLKAYDVIDEKLFDVEMSGGHFYKNAGIYEIELDGEIRCTDRQLVKVLGDDYKLRLVQNLSNKSNNSTYQMLKKQVENYENSQKHEIKRKHRVGSNINKI